MVNVMLNLVKRKKGMMKRFNLFRKTKFKAFNKNLLSFDIETYDNNKRICLIGFYDGTNYFSFRENQKEEALKFMLDSRNGVKRAFVATNLHFDILGLLWNSKYLPNFSMIEKAGKILFGKYRCGKRPTIYFYDTLSYANLSLQTLGELIKYPKLEHPDFLGQEPKNKKEWDIMLKYNKRDCELTYKGFRFLIESFEKLGATLSPTIAGTAKNLYTNVYIGDNTYKVHTPEVLKTIFESYKGGRCECFKRGKLQDNYYLFDVNSMYPYVMLKDYPNPNYLRINKSGRVYRILDRDGISKITIDIPKSRYPALPVTHKGKLIFPYGTITGTFTHHEIRYNIKLGAKIRKVFYTYYYAKNCKPFADYVTALYKIRQENKDNPMSYVTKILLNSLYGKTGQRFDNMTDLIHKDIVTAKQLINNNFDQLGDYYSIKKETAPASYCFPIWASYVTSYARTLIHEYIIKSNAIYTDTDSIITKSIIPSSMELGDVKKEYDIKEGLIVKPKFYYFTADNVLKIKIKGIGRKIKDIDTGQYHKLGINDLHDIISGKMLFFDRFAKIRESLHKGLIPNELIQNFKEFSLEDDKRIWRERFNPNVLQDSEPIHLII